MSADQIAAFGELVMSIKFGYKVNDWYCHRPC